MICGLGNPGREYEATRHNMGFIALDILADKLGVSVRTLKFRALTGEARIGREKIILVKPQTYMNLSGEAVKPIADYYKIPPENIVIIYDDIDLEPGTIRIRAKGSAGTHNGMRSVIYQLGTDGFPRVRIGTGKNGIIPLEKYVISRWTEEERPLLAKAAQEAADACVSIVERGVQQTMNVYNRKPEGEKRGRRAKDTDAGEERRGLAPQPDEAPKQSAAESAAPEPLNAIENAAPEQQTVAPAQAPEAPSRGAESEEK